MYSLFNNICRLRYFIMFSGQNCLFNSYFSSVGRCFQEFQGYKSITLYSLLFFVIDTLILTHTYSNTLTDTQTPTYIPTHLKGQTQIPLISSEEKPICQTVRAKQEGATGTRKGLENHQEDRGKCRGRWIPSALK